MLERKVLVVRDSTITEFVKSALRSHGVDRISWTRRGISPGYKLLPNRRTSLLRDSNYHDAGTHSGLSVVDLVQGFNGTAGMLLVELTGYLQ